MPVFTTSDNAESPASARAVMENVAPARLGVTYEKLAAFAESVMISHCAGPGGARNPRRTIFRVTAKPLGRLTTPAIAPDSTGAPMVTEGPSKYPPSLSCSGTDP